MLKNTNPTQTWARGVQKIFSAATPLPKHTWTIPPQNPPKLGGLGRGSQPKMRVGRKRKVKWVANGSRPKKIVNFWRFFTQNWPFLTIFDPKMTIFDDFWPKKWSIFNNFRSKNDHFLAIFDPKFLGRKKRSKKFFGSQKRSIFGGGFVHVC